MCFAASIALRAYTILHVRSMEKIVPELFSSLTIRGVRLSMGSMGGIVSVPLSS